MAGRSPTLVWLTCVALLGLVTSTMAVLGQETDQPPAEEPAVATPEPAAPSPARPPALQAREQLVQFPSGDLQLSGFVWKPEGDGRFPAILYNHGSEKLPGWKPELGQLFVGNGYVFLVPHRRGHGRSAGPYIQDQITQAPPADRNRRQVELLEEHVADQLAGLAFLRTLPYVDQSRIAVAGCSYGGTQTLLGAEANPGYRAAVDFAGAAQSWAGNPLLQQRLIRSVQNISIPIFLLQAENDYNTQPSLVLAAELVRLGRPHTMRIYPPFGTTRDDGHGGFCARGGDVWGADVFAFLREAMG